MKNVKILIITTMFCLVSSCGFLSDDPVKDQNIFVSNELSSKCTLDPDQFGDILDINIEAQIKCLEENFDQFSRYVRTNNRDTISEGELSNFVRKFFKSNSDTIIQGLKLIFELNMLLLKDEVDTISRDNLSPLFKLLVTVNKQAIIVTRALKEMQEEKDPLEVFEKRKILMHALQEFSDTATSIINRPGHDPRSIDLKKFLLELNDRIDTGDSAIDEKLAEALLFIKKIFVGGDKNILTSYEVEVAIKKLPKLILMATDLAFINKDHFKSKQAYISFQQSILKRFKETISPTNTDEPIFKIEDLFVIFDTVTSDDDDFDLRDYEKVFKSVKNDLIGGDDNIFTYKELQHLLVYIDISLEALKFNEEHIELTKEIKLLSIDEKFKVKSKYLSQVKLRAKRIENIIKDHGALPKNVNILNFAKTLTNEIDQFDFDIDFIDAIFGVKILVAGGTKSQLTQNEFIETLRKSHQIAEFYFNLAFIQDSFLQDSSAKWNFLEGTIAKATRFFTEDESLDALSLQDLGVILRELFSPSSDEEKELYGISLELDEVAAIIRTLKEDIFSTTPEQISIGEIRSTFSIAQLGMAALELIQTYSEKSLLAEQNPDDIEELTLELEEKAKRFEYKAAMLTPGIKYIKSNLDYEKILEALGPILEEDSRADDQVAITEYVRKLKPLKTLILGGQREFLTINEVKTLTTKTSSYIKAIFKLTNTDFTKKDSEELTYKTLLNSFSTIKRNFVLSRDISYFNGFEVMNSLDWFMNLNLEDGQEPINYKRFTPTLLKFKGRVIHGIKSPATDPMDYPSVNVFTANNIKTMLDWAHEGLETLLFSERTYKAYETELSRTSPINYLNLYRFSDYPEIRSGYITKLRKEFLKITKTHKHFTKQITRFDDENNEVTKFIQYFGKDIKREKYGFVQLAIIRFALKKAMLGYSVKVNNQDAVDVDRINMLLLDFKPVLEEFNLWTKNIETFGENTILLGDLFQNSSDGDNAINVDEGAEYASMVIVAVTLADEIMHKMKPSCENRGTEEDLMFMPRCYREHFLDSWLNRLDYNEYFPKLSSYYRSAPSSESTDFIRKTEGFARDVDDEKVPMGIRDYTLLVGALLNIESTFVRFDINNDNIIDTDELHKAFPTYQSSIMKIAELNGWKKMFTKTVFFYMVKNMRIPTETQVMKYHFQLHLNPMYKENIQAKRLNIGALLYNLIQYRSRKGINDDV